MEFTEEIATLAKGPSTYAKRFKGYILNGSRFRVKEVDSRRATQNSGIYLNVNTMSYASSKDKKPRLGDVTYYGVLTDILEIVYSVNFKFVLFKCDWVDTNAGMKQDDYNFTLLNFNHLLYQSNQVGDEPFILATQAKQAFYVRDPLDPDWYVAVKVTSRDVFDNISQHEAYRQQQLGETSITEETLSEFS
jgi:hypothetical protein